MKANGVAGAGIVLAASFEVAVVADVVLLAVVDGAVIYKRL